jgi:hypothetical protein
MTLVSCLVFLFWGNKTNLGGEEMKKLIQIFIVCSLLGILFVGCGEKLSPGGEKCMSSVKSSPTDGGKLEYLTQACKDYKGSDSDEDIGAYIMKKMDQKCTDEGVIGADCMNKYWSPDN